MFCGVPFQPSSNSNLGHEGHFHVGHRVYTYGDQMQQFSGHAHTLLQLPSQVAGVSLWCELTHSV